MKLVCKLERDKRTPLEKEYENAVLMLRACAPMSEDYDSQLRTVEKLHELLLAEKEQKKKLEPGEMLEAGLRALSILAILEHEQLHNITTKAMQFVSKGRLR